MYFSNVDYDLFRYNCSSDDTGLLAKYIKLKLFPNCLTSFSIKIIKNCSY